MGVLVLAFYNRNVPIRQVIEVIHQRVDFAVDTVYLALEDALFCFGFCRGKPLSVVL